ncbi:uncharacterized protein EI90DRAFT_3017244 [Cantharellus anzutake]|uniref:uncharacterized protein n=1 Tax=Cantharellus anzutake TaxID=1750568 RepID=UPI0019086654|nr:uncharacterized protein EI90DRAFT_3017244 [Cantharellus anzutake]KAF8329475.1 hypothetical protein EI90DRAFT_3017244 [Cantharellus anzutake]
MHICLKSPLRCDDRNLQSKFRHSGDPSPGLNAATVDTVEAMKDPRTKSRSLAKGGGTEPVFRTKKSNFAAIASAASGEANAAAAVGDARRETGPTNQNVTVKMILRVMQFPMNSGNLGQNGSERRTKTPGGPATWTGSGPKRAFRKANEKWTDEDCALCFPLLAEAVPHYLKKARKEAIDAGRAYATLEEAKITKSYDATIAIDALHACILEARRRDKARREENPPPPPQLSSYPDTWQPHMDPRASVRAHTVPLMGIELERVEKEIAAGEARNEILDSKLRANIAAQQEATARIRALLEKFHATVSSMSNPQIADLEQWAIMMEEEGKV